MGKAFKTIFFGLLLLTFHINIGQIKIFPSFVGFLVIYRGIVIFQKYTEDKNISLAKFSALGLVALSLLTGINSYILNGQFLNIYISIAVTMLSTLLEMIIVHKILQITIKNLQEKEANEFAESLMLRDKLYMVYYVSTFVVFPLQFIFQSFIIGMVFIVFLLAVRISLLLSLRKLQNWYENYTYSDNLNL